MSAQIDYKALYEQSQATNASLQLQVLQLTQQLTQLQKMICINCDRIADIAGEFVGMVADEPTNKIKLKTFHCEIINDHTKLQMETEKYRPLPAINEVTLLLVNENFRNIKKEIAELIEAEIERILNTPGLSNLTK